VTDASRYRLYPDRHGRRRQAPERGRVDDMRRFCTALLVGATIAASSVLTAVAPPASAVETPVPVRATPASMGQTNGTVYAVEHAGGRVFAGGNFTSIRPAGAAPGTGEIAQAFLAAFDAATGAPDETFRHTFTNTWDGSPGIIHAVAASPDGSRIYVGGDFNDVDGVRQEHVAAFDTATGELIPTFGAEGVNGRVYAIAATDEAVYVGGTFTKSNWRSRPRAAAIAPSGKPLPWAPAVNDSASTGVPVTVYAMAVDAGKVFVGGSFDTVNGTAAHGLVALDPTSAALLPYAGDVVPATSYVTSLNSDGQKLYATGRDNRGAVRFEGVKAFSLDTGTQQWYADCKGDSFDTQVLGGVVYVATHAHDCSRIGGWPESSPRIYTSIYTLNAADGSLLPFNPTMNGSATVAGSRDNTRSFATDGTQLFVGGGWTNVDGTEQANLARFTPTGPGSAPGIPWASATVDSTGAIVLRWRTVADLDDRKLTYSVYRTWRSTNPIYTATVDSTWWNRRSVSFVDTEAAPGVKTYYRVAVTDGTNTVFSVNTASVVPGEPASTYTSAVAADRPMSYWRLNDGTSTTAADASGNSRTGAYAGEAVRNQPSALSADTVDRSIGLDGVDDQVASYWRYYDPASFTVEAWVRTTSTKGGRLVGFGSLRDGTSPTTDRHVYFTSDGRLVFGVNELGPKTVQSTAAYNDGAWHHVVATHDAGGIELFVDGVSVGQDSSVQDAAGYYGYWRVGADNINVWPQRPISNGVAGDVDEVAIYPHALTSAEVAMHFSLR
jgi:hypothetical protein